MIRNIALLATWVFAACAAIGTARAEFTATYTALPNSPTGLARTWYSGGVYDGRCFVYGLGHSHNTNGSNDLYTFCADTGHRRLQPSTGNKWVYTLNVNHSGHWATLAPTDPLYAYFGGPDINAVTNRNNHQAFTVPWRNEFWVLAGTTFYQEDGHFAGRYSLTSERWSYVSTLGTPAQPELRGGLTQFSAGLIAGTNPGWVGANASVAVCPAIETIVVFGGMQDTSHKVRMIEPNPAGPEPMRWATTTNLPIGLPSENARHNAACVGDTVYFVTGQVRLPNVKCCTTLNPNPVWKFHVPTRTWTRLPDGPPGGYFPILTYDSDANALLYYGGGTGTGSTAMWAMDLTTETWQNLTNTTTAPRIHHHTGGYLPGFGHVFKGGEIFLADGTKDTGANARMFKINLTRVEPVATATPTNTPPTSAPQEAAPTGFTWTQIPLPGYPKSPQGSMKHQRLVEGPGGRVYLVGGDWGGGPHYNTGRQEVYSFDPLSTTGDWRMEAPYCGTLASPTNFHTDEAGVAWDAKRGVFWKLAGTVYGSDTACPPGTSVKAKVIQFNPATKQWAKPQGFDQPNIGYVTNGALDADQMIQITDTAAWHLNLMTGAWKSYALPGDVKRFSALTTRIGRELWFGNQQQAIESYHLDTHALTNHGRPPWPTAPGYGTFMTANAGGKLLVVKPTAGPEEPRHAGLYDPATKHWTVLDQGEGWGNTGVLHSSGQLILMGGGINGPAYHNKFVWIGTLN